MPHLGRGVGMKRRQFLGALVGAAVAQPRAALAQQQRVPLLGFLSSRSANDSTRMLDGFRRGLAEAGYTEGRNVAIEYRWAEGHYERLAPLAAELVGMPISVLFTVGGEPAARAAVAATKTIPVVTVFASDPVNSGLIGSLSHPGGNVTGVSILSASIEQKRIGLLKELMPQATRFGALLNPKTPTYSEQLRDIEAAARSLNVGIDAFQASDDQGLERALRAIEQQGMAATLVSADPFLLYKRAAIAAFAARGRLAVMYPYRDFPDAGGLMSYGVDLADAYRQMASYAGRIIGGARPAELPVAQPTKFEFVINLKTAKALGMTIPPTMLALADEVID